MNENGKDTVPSGVPEKPPLFVLVVGPEGVMTWGPPTLDELALRGWLAKCQSAMDEVFKEQARRIVDPAPERTRFRRF